MNDLDQVIEAAFAAFAKFSDPVSIAAASQIIDAVVAKVQELKEKPTEEKWTPGRKWL